MSDTFYYAHPDKNDLMVTPTMLMVSEDGYIRLSFHELQRVQLHHLLSGLYETEANPPFQGVTQAIIAGYTEWLSDTSPKITIGWDWQMEFVDRRTRLNRVGMLHSNIMLQDAHRKDIGAEKSLLLLELRMDEMDWQSVVMEAIYLRYE